MRSRHFAMMPVATPSVDELKKFMANENKRWGGIVRDAGVAGSM